MSNFNGLCFTFHTLQDNVTCFLCKEEYAEWEHDDDPHEIHIKISPKCPWALVRCALELDKDDDGQSVYS